MLVGITFGMPRQSKQLPALAADIEEQNQAQSGTIGANMYYFRKREGPKKIDGLVPLRKFQTAWKSALENYAKYPFANGMKLLPAGLVEQFVKVNQQYEKAVADVWKQWAEEEYPKWKADAPTRMGALYEEHDFPSLEDCKDRYKCSVVVMPMSQAEQWSRIHLISKDLAATMAEQQNQAVEAARRMAHVQLWRDVMTPIQHIVDTLNKEKPKLFESMLGNVIAICDLLPAYNEMTNDSQLQSVAAAAKQAFQSVSIEDLRKSQEVRDGVKAKAAELVNQFSPYARAFAEEDDEEQQS